jgi:hypothetical protein
MQEAASHGTKNSRKEIGFGCKKTKFSVMTDDLHFDVWHAILY